ncbi:MAG: hypothetical protein ACRYGG_21030 [Janthinobacterium lividum]
MTAVLVDIAEAVTDLLNGMTLSQEFSAVRCYVPNHKVTDPSLKLYVVPADQSVDLEAGTRRVSQDTYTVFVGVYKQVARDVKGQVVVADVDRLFGFVQELIDAVKSFDVLPTYQECQLVGIDQYGRAFDVKSLESLGTFAAIMALEYQLFR